MGKEMCSAGRNRRAWPHPGPPTWLNRNGLPVRFLPEQIQNGALTPNESLVRAKDAKDAKELSNFAVRAPAIHVRSGNISSYLCFLRVLCAKAPSCQLFGGGADEVPFNNQEELQRVPG